MSTIKVLEYNSTSVKVIVDGSDGIYDELYECFSFESANARFNPKVIKGLWDGIIRMYSKKTNLLPYGLVNRLKNWCKINEYDIEIYDGYYPSDLPTIEEFNDFIKQVKLPFEPRQYQLDCVYECLKKRKLISSPTSSGKSLIIYLTILALNHFYDLSNTLIIVPTIALVDQMKRDFESYANESLTDVIHLITAGVTKTSDKPIVISTWQSLIKCDKRFFSQFNVLLVDEVHVMSSDVSSLITKNSMFTKVKIGFSGTIASCKLNELILIGLFGDIYVSTTTKKLMDNKEVSTLKIVAIPLDWKVKFKGVKYRDEILAILLNNKRNKLIANLANSMNKNTLVLFNELDHINMVLEKLNEINNTDKKVYVVTGDTPLKERTEISRLCELDNNIIILATYGVFQAGISILNLHNVIFARPSKSPIRIIQSIGRILRNHVNKDVATVYDLFDLIDGDINTSRQNHTLRHFIERYKIYKSSKFKVQIIDKYRI